MDFEKANEKKWKHHENHFRCHYGIALKEFKFLKLLDECDLLTPKAIKHFDKLKYYLNNNLNRYLDMNWFTKTGV